MEQQLINAFMKLTAKIGAGPIIRDLIKRTDENGNPKKWTESELENAIAYINSQIEKFGKSEAIMVIYTLMKKFQIHPAELITENEPVQEQPGVQGLQ